MASAEGRLSAVTGPSIGAVVAAVAALAAVVAALAAWATVRDRRKGDLDTAIAEHMGRLEEVRHLLNVLAYSTDAKEREQARWRIDAIISFLGRAAFPGYVPLYREQLDGHAGSKMAVDEELARARALRAKLRRGTLPWRRRATGFFTSRPPDF